MIYEEVQTRTICISMSVEEAELIRIFLDCFSANDIETVLKDMGGVESKGADPEKVDSVIDDLIEAVTT